MKRRFLIVGLILLAVFTISAASAVEDADVISADDADVNLTVDDAVDEVAQAADEEAVEASADEADVEEPVGDADDDAEIVQASENQDNLKEGIEDFNIVFAKEVSVKDRDATVVTFDWPDWVPKMAGVVTVKVIGSSVYTQQGKFDNTHGVITLSELGIDSPNTYSILFTYGDDLYTKVGSVKVSENGPKPVITGNKDITMLYTANSYYKVRVTLGGVPVSGQYVTFKFNGNTKKVKTDSKGYATYKIPNVAPKKAKYTITATYQSTKVSNKVKVNSIIVSKNMKVQKSKKVTKVKVSLKKVNNKYLAGKKLTLKFKGKKFKATTSKKGVATFKLQKNVFKNLKVGKKYKYTVTYVKDTASKVFTIAK